MSTDSHEDGASAPSWRARVDEALERNRAGSETPVLGCSEVELADFEQRHGLQLPASYRRFLRATGKRSEFLMGSDLLFHELAGLQSEAQRLLADEEEPPSLPKKALVFCGHQGYQFLFFELAGAADPEVLYFLQGRRDFQVVAASFSEWLASAVRDEYGGHGDGAQ
ncbi:MAG: SMI1/KNR4 family protein [Acidobacteriota bacterium]